MPVDKYRTKFTRLLAALLLFTAHAFAQTVSKEQFEVVWKKLPLEKDPAKKAMLLKQAASYYVERENPSEKDLDSASLFNRESMRISQKFGLKKQIAQSLLLDGQIAVTRNQNKLGTQLRNKALQYAHRNGLKKEMADVYRAVANDFAANAEMTKAEKYYRKALALYRQAGALAEEADTYSQMANEYQYDEQLERSTQYARQAIRIKKQVKRQDTYKELYYISYNFLLLGDHDQSLTCLLEAEKKVDNTNDSRWKMLIYDLLGGIYGELKFFDQSIAYYNKSLVIAKKNGETQSVRTTTENTASILHGMGKTAEALALLEKEIQYKPGNECNMYYSSIYLSLHCILKQYDKGKPYYENLLKCNQKDAQNNMLENRVRRYDVIIKYLIGIGQAYKTRPYVDSLKQLVNQRNNNVVLAGSENTYFKADSAVGNYRSAIAHLQKYKSLSDSLFNISNAKQFADLQLKYETEKKEKNIKLLNSQNQLIRIKSEKAQRTKNITLVGAALLLIIVGLLYYLYHTKQKTNRKLEAHQRELDQKNDYLEALNTQQDKLIKEKEWLIKEVHHRVKNNLQMVTSLLYSQSMYLKDDAAKLAVKDSLRRMQAMALIHQKLYQDENTSAIAMPEYINELVHYLQESFDAGNQITFRQTVEPVHLDVSQAIPLGLIITESIVNAIKYAFLHEQNGIVDIVLQHDGADYLLLKIADNGIGLPDEFDTNNTTSLGLDLIKGLAKQLNGSMAITNSQGVQITVRFVILNK
ncbi:histidine kinase dimerization/phosphoacceptor domain -containing protein [Flavobacterium sp.]|uniref:tetratricopeptide repeat-containing sensor histidine kinase n=1 Tax=Flavobacterium sp. TaxID=239 RepID=UPI0039E5A60E